jgi:hypothetical protein
MFTVVLRSACVGIAAVIVSAVLGVFVGGFILARNAPMGQVEVGWDLVSMAHNTSPDFLLLPLLIFAIAFALAFRSFSRSPSRNL